MQIQRNIPMVLFIFLIINFILLACNKDNGTNPGTQSTAKISGRVTNDTGFGNSLTKTSGGVEGATVTVVQVQADGSLQTVSTESVTTNASGEYIVETELDNANGLIVLAEKANAQWKSVITAEVNNGETTKCQPHNDESTTEAETYEQMKRRKELRPKQNFYKSTQSEDAFYADIAMFVNAEVAANIGTNQSAIDALATAIEAKIEAHEQVLSHASIGASQTQIETANAARIEAQIQLEAALCEAAGQESEANAAFENYADAVIDAYVDANIAIESYAKAKEISCGILIKNSTGLNVNALFAMTKSSAIIRARAKSQACASQFSEAGASNAETSTVVTAGGDLRLALQNATSDSEIDAAFHAYHDAVISELQTSLSTQATAIASVEALINGVGGAKSVFETSLSAAVTTEAVINAYLNFYAAVRTLVETTLATASDTEIDAVVEILILTNVSA